MYKKYSKNKTENNYEKRKGISTLEEIKGDPQKKNRLDWSTFVQGSPIQFFPLEYSGDREN